MADLPQLVRDIRTRINALQPLMSREEIAPKLGVTYSWLCKFMQQHKDAANPRIGTLQKVLQGLDVVEGAARQRLKRVNGTQARE